MEGYIGTVEGCKRGRVDGYRGQVGEWKGRVVRWAARRVEGSTGSVERVAMWKGVLVRLGGKEEWTGRMVHT